MSACSEDNKNLKLISIPVFHFVVMEVLARYITDYSPSRPRDNYPNVIIAWAAGTRPPARGIIPQFCLTSAICGRLPIRC